MLTRASVHVMEDESMKEYIDTYKAIADETRLRILYLLINKKSEICACEFTDALEIPQYNISKHLRILKSAGLIEERKEGRWIYFRLSREKGAFRQTVFKSIHQIPASLLTRDLGGLEKRFSMRKYGKCVLGIRKKHLRGARTGRK